MSDRYILKDAKMQLYNHRNAIRKDIELQPVTILSNTCIGGRFYHDYGAKFLSPTIDSYIAPADFVRFCSNLEHYLAVQPIYDARYEFMKNFFPFKLDNIHVCFGHTTH